MAQATRSQPGLPICRDISAETMKIPEPIITPTTSMVESKSPSPRENSALGLAFLVGAAAISIGDCDLKLSTEKLLQSWFLTSGYCIHNMKNGKAKLLLPQAHG